MKLTIHCYAACLSVTFAITAANAQSAYGVHTLVAGETLSVLAKSYHTTVGDIMRMNGMNAQSQLQVGAQIKIPAGGTVVVPKPAVVKTVAAAAVPVKAVSTNPKTHVVATSETLFHISQLYNIPVEQLKAINNIPDGSVKVGQTLLLSGGAVPSKPVKVKTEETNAMPAEEAPVKEAAQPAPVKQSPPSAAVMAETPPQSHTAQVTNVTKTNEASSADNSNAFSNNYPLSSNAPKEGFFTSLYGKDLQSKEETKNGAAMTFKSASGWADKKYYILMNDVPTGSVVKIKNGKNELYAKVLWSLSEMKENDGLAFRISTAAAAALGITDQKFDLRVSYYE